MKICFDSIQINLGTAEFFKKSAIYFFVVSVLAATLQGAGLSFATLYHDLPASAHKYINNFPQYTFLKFGFIWFFLFSIVKVATFLISVISIFFYYIQDEVFNDRQRFFLYIKSKRIIIIFLIIGIIPSVLYCVIQNKWFQLAVGGKTLLPVLAIFIGISLSLYDLKKLSRWLDWGVVACLVISLLQLIQAYKYCDGICVRTTGLFIEPNTLASFALGRILILYLDRGKYYLLTIAISGLVIFLAGSRSIGIAFLISCIFFYGPNTKKLMTLFSIGLAGIFFSILSGRGIESILIRLRNFYTVDLNAIIFGNGLGSGTQASHLYAKFSGSTVVPLLQSDMQVLSLIHQGGLWLIIFLATATLWTFIFSKNNNLKYILLVFWSSGAGIISMEVWPLNIMIFMCIGYALLKKNSCKGFNESNS